MIEIERIEYILEGLAFMNEDDARFLGKYIKKLDDKIKLLEEKINDLEKEKESK